MLIIRRLNCVDAASGIVTLSKWPSGATGWPLRLILHVSAKLGHRHRDSVILKGNYLNLHRSFVL